MEWVRLRRLHRLFLRLLAASALLESAWADGKVYHNDETVPPSIPFQRALILQEDGTETLFLQSRYQVASGGHETNLLLYLLSDRFYATDERMELGFAEKLPHPPLSFFHFFEERHQDFFPETTRHLNHLMKFKQQLSPADMENDLIFHPNPQQVPYRSTKWKW